MSKVKNEPKISVIVPIYKVEKYLPACVDSILAQSYENLEIILVDDGSPDECPKLCDEYATKDDRIVIVHKENGGLSDARNAGLDMARGKYICFVDSDDYVDVRYIEKLYAALDSTGADMSVCGYTLLFEDGTEERDETTKNEVLEEDDYWEKVFDSMFTSFVVAWNKLYKKEIFEVLRYEKGKNNEDELILHKVLEQCEKVSVISDRLYYYRKRKDSIMGLSKRGKLTDSTLLGLLERSKNFLERKKYGLCARQLYTILGFIETRRQARKFSKAILSIAKKIPSEYKSKDFNLKMAVLRFVPSVFGLKQLR